jgi:hypothetical protein
LLPGCQLLLLACDFMLLVCLSDCVPACSPFSCHLYPLGLKLVC